ncbi:LOB domain-containing protein 27-like [Primulina tabacum]|uniref:LOB domain-containing protein 27-like n=1 Tax=Primulina tabacum TaxID=48773 RepID=UPI003F5A9866
MTEKGGTTPACAVCKYQRRKCTTSCPLAPYFPANQSKIFRNVHRLFGVSAAWSPRIKGMIDAMKPIIYEAEMRDRFPVYCCSVIICDLRFQLQQALSDLRAVSSQAQDNQFFLNENHEFYLESLENMARPFMELNICPDIVTGNNFTVPFHAQVDVSNRKQERNVATLNYEGLKFDPAAEDRQSYIETKEACESRYDQT